MNQSLTKNKGKKTTRCQPGRLVGAGEMDDSQRI